MAYGNAIKDINHYVKRVNQEFDVNFNADYRLNMTAHYFEQLIPGYQKKIQ